MSEEQCDFGRGGALFYVRCSFIIALDLSGKLDHSTLPLSSPFILNLLNKTKKKRGESFYYETFHVVLALLFWREKS